MRRHGPGGLALLLAAVATSAVQAQSLEFWPELQFQYRYDDRSKLIGMLALARDIDELSVYQAEQGLLVEHIFADWFRGRLGYRHASATDGGPFSENRLLTEQTFRVFAPAEVMVDLRTREDFRWLNTGFSFRLRERLQAQRDMQWRDWTFTPYASAEIFYDTRYDQISRLRFVGGVALPVGAHFTVEPYYALQPDLAPQPALVHAVGLVLTTAF
ncbi:Protein of unknown function [Enhydrobacter aerosaccus]|uniref:DUF2490 domain-containing protein n=1 Tax=Enhydrobacter aerosaccus TaxID=225324 RepID=A0A1T4TDK4_9HYPH|nr:DUF2490 domain-containing protein [Enhydrobacter aerosaccus]SKA38585.1 Protein of unknown function [Enhydrobacter aerosaccus]